MNTEGMQTDTLRTAGNVEFASIFPVFPNSNKPCVNVWMDKMSKGILTSTHFKEHWRIWVPKIYSPEPNGNCLDWSFDEGEAQKMLYNTLEEFICNGDPREVLKQLRQMDNPPAVCGRVFRIGEPTYFCRECAMDATCVLCVDCFKESVHVNHKYKMGTSGGGGCCDCGDAEAWKKEPFCKTHLLGTRSKEASSKKLPDDIAMRAVATFEAVLKYCYELLTLERSPGLPPDLQVRDSEEDPLSLLGTTDTYCTVLFNDETHTFDQVISTLTKVIKCSQKDAIEFVTNIDRDGRAVVKCSDFQHCNELKSDVERFTARHSNRPLKVLVVHAHVVAHQIFAMKLLGWLQQFISLCEGFRIIFSDVALNTKAGEGAIVTGILMGDSQLWKSARTAWHRLFISGMLMEYESKKALAIVFTYNYGPVMKDFIRDDHDHSFSITSLSVQLFTVPTLAHHLIANHDVLFILLNTFISESLRKCNSAGKLEFERNTPNTSFKRAQYILYDLKYLLTSKPDTWTDELRRGFLQGISLLLTFLCSMQWMDAVLRQVGQHMEYEPEWESAFNLHIKLSPVISLALEWCGSDRIALRKAVRLVLRKLAEELSRDEPGPGQLREIADHSATCLQYDVAAEPVSIHLPLSRFLAGLFLYLEKHDLHFQSNEFAIGNRPTPEQIIEPVLRAQAMISQVHAGMWRRNGYSLLNQLYFYHNVRCRTEMLDRDIILLQVGASLIESNEFLIHVLNKFNLTNWADTEFETNSLKNPEEDSTRQTINLVEEFLGLLITIIGERHVPGIGQVTADDRLKKEIIQQLCIKPLSHSELNKTLPEGIHHETGLERVIDEVAEFKKPLQSSTGKGVYELKPHLYSEYNVFFYHYTKEELSKSEEAQRKRRKAMDELECCPPPKLPKLTDSFSIVANLLQCDVMLHIMQTVLERALNLRARTFSEPQVHKILHLIGYALQEEESGNYEFFIFTSRAQKWNIYKLLESLSSSPRIDEHKDLLTWVLGKYREIAGASGSGTEATATTAIVATASTASSSSPQANEPTGDGGGDPAKTSKEWRAKMAAEKRAKVMAQMAAMQKNFMKTNATLFEEIALDSGKSNDRGSYMDLTECDPEDSGLDVGPRQTTRILGKKTYTCILCQEDQAVTASGKAMVLAAFVQQSTVLCQTRVNVEEPNPLYLSSKLGASPHASTCGHVMHADCWEKYSNSVRIKESRRPYRMRQLASFDVEEREYLCPLCECLSNTVLPLLPPLGIIRSPETDDTDVDFETWLKAMRIVVECSSTTSSKTNAEDEDDDDDDDDDVYESGYNHDENNCRYCFESKLQSLEIPDEGTSGDTNERKRITCPIKTIYTKISEETGRAFESMYKSHDPELSQQLITMIHLFARAPYIKHNTFSTKGFDVTNGMPRDEDPTVPRLAWKSTAYTVHAIEFMLRDMEKPLFGALSSRQCDSIECLARLSGVFGSTWPNNNQGFISGIGIDAIDLLTMILSKSSKECFLDWDPLGILIPLMMSLPSLLNTSKSEPASVVIGGPREAHVLKLVFVMLIAKILATSDFADCEAMDVDQPEYSEATVVPKTASTSTTTATNQGCESIVPLMEAMGLEIGRLTISQIWQSVKDATLPFLRCCALYFHFVTDVPVPAVLINTGGDTYENMCNYLGLPTSCNELLDSNVVRELARGWMEHPNSRSRQTAVKEPLRINRLVPLPDDYSELINTVSLFTCPNSDREDSRNPTMCLVCGEMLCSQSYCCQTELNKTTVGACTYHASKCGTGVGVFIRVRECEILFLRSPNRGAFACPPYLDEYGETDQGLRRGNPLKLCTEKYKQLNQMWLGHGLHESIARAIEASSNHTSTQWHHL